MDERTVPQPNSPKDGPAPPPAPAGKHRLSRFLRRLIAMVVVLAVALVLVLAVAFGGWRLLFRRRRGRYGRSTGGGGRRRGYRGTRKRR